MSTRSLVFSLFQGFICLIIHEKYDCCPETYDFAIVKLESVLRFSAEIAAVCLPDPRFSASKYAGQEGVVSGWGKTDIRAINTSPVLKDLKVRIFSNEECKELKNDYIKRKELSEKWWRDRYGGHQKDNVRKFTHTQVNFLCFYFVWNYVLRG